MGFPKKVLPKSAPQALCHGLAKLYDLPTRGRRSMLGAVVPDRTDEHFSNTSAALAAVVQSDTDIQCRYQIPMSAETHEATCEGRAFRKKLSGDMK
eukprot:3057198-Karenia_brevis.AAC.1